MSTEIPTFDELLNRYPDHLFFVMNSGATVLDGFKCDTVEVRDRSPQMKMIKNEIVLHEPANINKAKQHNQSIKEIPVSEPKKAKVIFSVTKKEVEKKAARMPFKNETVPEYLEQKDEEGLVAYLSSLSQDENYEAWKVLATEIREDESNHILREYQEFLDKHLQEILPKIKTSGGPWNDGNVFPCWAPSFLAGAGLKFPVNAIPNLAIMDLLDDYYNCLYNPGYPRTRYTSDPMTVFRTTVREKVKDISGQIRYSIDSRFYTKDALSELTNIWGISAVKAWWRGLDEEEVIKLKDMENEVNGGMVEDQGLYHDLCEKFGGGLAEDWVKSWGGLPSDVDLDGDGRAPMRDELPGNPQE